MWRCPPPPPCELALITAQSDSAVVPEGYSQLYVLTTGAELSIEAVNGEGSFEIAKEGSYTVHSFVLQTDLIETVAGLDCSRNGSNRWRCPGLDR